MQWQGLMEAVSHGQITRLLAIAAIGQRARGAVSSVAAVIAQSDGWPGLEAARAMYALTGDQDPLVSEGARYLRSTGGAGASLLLLRKLHGLAIQPELTSVIRQLATHGEDSVRDAAARTLASLRGDIDSLLREWSEDRDPLISSAATHARESLSASEEQ